MADRVGGETVESLLDDYTGPQQDAVMDALDAERVYVADGRRVEPEDIPAFGSPDSEFWQGASRQEVEEFDEALSTLRRGYREEEPNGEKLVLNEEAMYDQIAPGSIRFYAPWNVGLEQDEQEIGRSVRHLQEFAEVLEDETVLDVEVTIYTLDVYAENNGNPFRRTKRTVADEAAALENLSVLGWDGFEDQILGKELDPALGYEGLRKTESGLMSGEVRLSPAEKPGQEDKPYVERTGNPRENEAVVYGPFIGPWKSGYGDRVDEVPGLIQDMRSDP